MFRLPARVKIVFWRCGQQYFFKYFVKFFISFFVFLNLFLVFLLESGIKKTNWKRATLPCKSTKLASYLPFRRFQHRCRSHFQLHQIFKMMFFSSSFPVFPKRFTRFLKICERGSRILKTVNNLSHANIHIVILLSLCCNISFKFYTTLHATRGRNKRD